MAKLNFKNGRVEDFTFVLSTRDYRHLGQLVGVKSESAQNNNLLSSANELSFTICKTDLLDIPHVYTDEIREKILKQREALWLLIVDHKLLWVKELDEYYDITVSIDDAAETIKTITGKTLCESELSQYNIDSLEINTELDINRKDYRVTMFCNFADTEASLLHRALKDKAPHYTIEYVDDSLMNLEFVREFSVSGKTIYDFLTGEVAEQYNCLFVFNSARRGISVYDLYTTCLECRHRGDFYEECPICKNKDKSKMKYFGKDTTILVDKNNLTDAIHLETNGNEMKNCLKMVAGDDLMTTTVRLLNQNGSDYLMYLSENQMKDMPKELVQKLLDYKEEYDNASADYQKKIEEYYDLTDEILYLESGMMPDVEIGDINAGTEVVNLTETNLSPIGLSDVSDITHSDTVNSAIKNYAKLYVKTGYVKLEVSGKFTYEGEHVAESASDSYHYGYWTGTIKVINYSDENDVATTPELILLVHDKLLEFTKQKVLKKLAEESNENSVFDVLAIEDIDKFADALTYYSKNRLTSFRDAIQGALDVLIQMNQSEETSLLYNDFYVPYSEKLQMCQSELDRRLKKIDEVNASLEKVKNEINQVHSKFDMRTYLGEDLYKIYCAYRREDTYENSNYISDGLDNVALIKRAKEFIEEANKELKRVAEPQFTLSSTLKNLLVLEEFEPLVKYFELGNWLRLRVDGELYRLRLIGYTMNFGSIQDLNVEFSTVSKFRDVKQEALDIVQKTQSLATSMTYVAQQAKQGENANEVVNEVIAHGLNAAYTQITNNDNEEITYGKNGILCRSYDDVTDSYGLEQMKITHNVLAFTKDGWESTITALGKHVYLKYIEKNEETGEPGNRWEYVTDYGLTTNFVTAGHISGTTIVGGVLMSNEYDNGTTGNERKGSYIDMDNGTFDLGAGRLVLTDDSLELNNGAFKGGSLLIGDEEKKGAYAEITPEGILNCQGANFTGTVKGSTVIGGEVKSENYSNEDGKREGSYINLETGELDLGGGGLTYLDGKFQIASKTVTDTLKEIGIFDDNLKIKASNINAEDGYISLKEDVQDIPLTKISGTSNGLITSNQIESIDVSKIDGEIIADKLSESTTLSSSQIAKELSDKEVTGSFNGDITADTVKVTSDGTTYTGLTGEFTINTSATLKIVNGIIVAFTENN